MIEFRKQENGEFKVYYENGSYMGDISRAHDFNYNFWPELGHGGFWPTHVLRSIVEFLDTLNKPLDDEMNAYFDAHPPMEQKEFWEG